ncbi:MAG TPA: alkaline phosphatase D family protein [Myxococcota bacterium]|nr:alkaline phosphatase D family protein [Myxococcota bacterium]
MPRGPASYAPLSATRRELLRAAAVLGASWLVPSAARAAVASATGRVRFIAPPFALGVASGYPTPDGFTLWTRLAPAPFEEDGGMDAAAVPVRWQVSEDERFGRVVAEGTEVTHAGLSHSLHVDVSGLRPARWYWYRFMAGDEISPVGRTRTAPAPDSTPRSLALAFASCQDYEHGYYAAYRHMRDEDLDLVAFLGDYIYESTWGSTLVRRHAPAGESRSLAEYRVRHAQYKTDPDLQAIHAATPWICTWDDHEVSNDYADDQSERLEPAFLARRAAAYQAYFEHMPLPVRMAPVGPSARIYTTVDFGTLARFYLLDDRQYRSHQACQRPGRGGSSVVGLDCKELEDPARTLLGADQEAWLAARFAESRARWNVIAQQSLFSFFDNQQGPGETVWTDAWSGYPAARRRLLDALQRAGTRNPVVIGGDIHANVVANVHLDARDPASPVVAAEVCGTSITSEGRPTASFWGPLRADNPHVLFADGDRRGYATLRLDAKRCRVALRVVHDVHARDTGIETAAAFEVEDGRPGIRPA